MLRDIPFLKESDFTRRNHIKRTIDKVITGIKEGIAYVHNLRENALASMGNKEQKKRTLLIIDDCQELGLITTPDFQALIANRRHLGVSVILSTQRLQNAVPPLVRNNCNILVMSELPNREEAHFVYQMVGGTLTKVEWTRLLDLVFDSPYKLLVVHVDNPIKWHFSQGFDRFISFQSK